LLLGLEAALQQPIYYTYSHGDTNLGNLFYDEMSDRISFIDLYALHQSVDIHGNPLSDPIMDLVRIEDGLHNKAANLLTADEIETILSSFYNAYETLGGTVPDERHLLFYRTFISLRRLAVSSNYMKEEDPLRRAFDKAAFEEEIKRFITLMSMGYEKTLN
jgi:hypothetical protein